MEVLVNFPQTEEGKNLFLNNLAIFKAELLLQSIDNIKVNEEVKNKVLEKVLEILNNYDNYI